MGRVKWHWLAVLGLLIAVVLVAPAVSEQPADATSQTEEKTDAQSAETEAPAQSGLEITSNDTVSSSCTSESGTCPTCPLELPLIPPSDDPVPSASNDATDLLDGGVTATAQTDAIVLTPVGGGTAAPADQGIVIPLFTSPDSGAFPLTDRQQQLSLMAQADTRDPGDRPATNPAPAKTKPSAQPKIEANPPPVLAQVQPSADSSKPAETVPVEVATISVPDTAQPLDEGPSLLAELDLPENTTAADEPSIIPSEQFSERELLALDNSDAITAAGLQPAAGAQHVGVIATRQPKPDSEPTLGDVLRGHAEDPELGSQVPGLSPWRSLSIVLACLALLFIGAAVSKKIRVPFATGKRTLNVMESINLGTGRQIAIVEMGDNALVLGVTPQSINLLDKVPLGLMLESYRGTVNSIINRESKALPADWAQRPVFTITEDAEPTRLAPPINGGTYGPSGQRISVSELRQSRAANPFIDNSGLLKPPAYRRSSEAMTKADLINRVRQELSRLED
ncbi:flagellar biosynthetic protein FliO [bacterium]|nr:flagellar biosynthetic protein FliO [bacterium]